jgi:hypothetical protein
MPGGGAVMGDVQLHRSDPDRFAKIPNDTARYARLSWAARGYLTEMMSNEPGWLPEDRDAAVRRARDERGAGGESVRDVRRILAELEHEGFRHRLQFRGERGRLRTETHYYDVPTWPCEDPKNCASCQARPGEWL